MENEVEKCKKLRVRTGEGLMTCKKLLENSDWNVDKAFKLYWSDEWLEHRVNRNRI